eukprot:COSAG06_NODE_9733_length_1830_cov_1.972848_1_plen_78_part_00
MVAPPSVSALVRAIILHIQKMAHVWARILDPHSLDELLDIQDIETRALMMSVARSIVRRPYLEFAADRFSLAFFRLK